MIVFRNVSKFFGKKPVLNDVSFQVNPGEFVCVFGASGSGKTTLLSLLLGMTHPTSGSVEIDGANLRSVPAAALQIYRRRIGMVFQDGKLLPYATVRENIALPLEIWGAPEAWMQKRLDELLSTMGLADKGDALPADLSTGERAKVGLARAMAAKPLILLADEPTGSLDPSESTAVIRKLKSLQKEGTTIVLATHDQALVDLLGVRVLKLENGVIVSDAEESKKKTSTVANERHEMFGEERPVEEELVRPVAPMMQQEVAASEEVPVKAVEEPRKTRKKVHITSINS